MHPLLVRQLRKAGLAEPADPAVRKLLVLVSNAYEASDDDRKLLESSIELASEEVHERNRRLEDELAQRARLSQQLDVSTQQAEDSERRYRALFELAPVGILAVEFPDGYVRHVNRTIADMLCIPREQLLGSQRAELVGLVADFGVDLGARERREVVRFGPFERSFNRPSAEKMEVMVSGIITPQEEGRFLAWVIVQDISERKAAERKLEESARSDKLTGLATRVAFMERLQQAIARVQAGTQRGFGVLFLDFDRFKQINDTLGHQAGDELLISIGRRLTRQIGHSDVPGADGSDNVVSRFGGDEFLVLLNGVESHEAAVRAAGDLLEVMSAAHTVRGTELHSSASIGVVTSFQGLTGAEDMIRKADLAMYGAKHAGRGCVMEFDDAMHARLTRQVTIESSLRRALATRGELRMDYQPLVELDTGKVVSYEALLRWRQPALGEVSPVEFIPVAEECGLIVPLGQWVLRQVCQDMHQWHQRAPQSVSLTVSTNVSRMEIAQGRTYVETVSKLLREFGLPPQSLQLELTEREVSRNPEGAMTLLRELHALGVHIAMDDFGTGTSSLGMLRGFRFDTVKIDRALLRNLVSSVDGLAVLHAAVDLIENLGMASVAEGVEDASQVAVLQSLGCRYAQGFHLGQPAPLPGAA